MTLKEQALAFEYVNLWINNPNDWKLIKKAYRGGLTYVNPKYQLKELNDITVYDVNSLYPFILDTKLMPYGKPSYEDLDNYTYKIYKVTIEQATALYIPFVGINLKERDAQISLLIDNELQDYQDFNDMQYPKKIQNVILYMDSYLINDFEKYYTGSWTKEYKISFKERHNLFSSYINKWRKIKENNKGAVCKEVTYNNHYRTCVGCQKVLCKEHIYPYTYVGKDGFEYSDNYCEDCLEKKTNKK